MFLDVGTPEPEEGPPSALEDLSCHLSELLDSEPLSQPIGDDCLSPIHSTCPFLFTKNNSIKIKCLQNGNKFDTLKDLGHLVAAMRSSEECHV